MSEFNEKIAKLEMEIEILKERVEQHQKQNKLSLLSYRNYIIIIVTLISIIGIGTVKYVVVDISSKAAQKEAAKGVSAILNEDYISKEIQFKSKTALKNIISEAESRAKELVSLGYLFNNYISKASDLVYYNKVRPKSLEHFNKAFNIWQKFSETFPTEDSFYFLIYYSEIQTINYKYDQAMETCSLSKEYANNAEQKALILLYEIVNLNLLQKDYSDQMKKYDEVLNEIEVDQYLHWSFDLLKIFIKDKENSFKEEDINLVTSLTDKIKQKINLPWD